MAQVVNAKVPSSLVQITFERGFDPCKRSISFLNVSLRCSFFHFTIRIDKLFPINVLVTEFVLDILSIYDQRINVFVQISVLNRQDFFESCEKHILNFEKRQLRKGFEPSAEK